jgi:cytoskeleton protein RodZ
MTGFGEYLRRERELRGVSLEEISGATKISIRFLQAIENEELSVLPGGIFTRSFVRTYARFLGLDEERVLADCQLADMPKVEVDIRHITANRALRHGGASRTWIIALLMAGALLAGGYALFRYSRRVMEQQSSTPVLVPPNTSSPGSNPPANAAPGQPSPPGPSETNPSLTATPASPAGATGPGTARGVPPSPEAEAKPAYPSATPEAAGGAAAPKANPANQAITGGASEVAGGVATSTDLVLQVAATERAWVAVDADGKTVLQKVLNPNEVETLKGRNSFDVTIGNAQGVVLTLNGETLKPLGRRGEVKSVHLTRGDLKNAAHER